MSHFSRFLRNILLSGFVCTSLNFASQDKQTKELSFGQEIVVGSCMGIADAAVSNPFYYFKNALQEGKSLHQISKNPIAWYRGSAANSFGLTMCALMQNTTCSALKKNKNEKTPWHIAAATGAITAPISCSTDFILRHVQSTATVPGQAMQKESTHKAIFRLYAAHGLRCFARGLGVTAVRDAVFTAAYLRAIPDCRGAIEQRVGNTPAAQAITWSAGCGIGLATTVLTHPFDTVAGKLQNDPGKKTYQNTVHAAQAVYRQQGVRGFFSGIMPRAMMISISLLALERAKITMEHAIKKWIHAQEI